MVAITATTKAMVVALDDWIDAHQEQEWRDSPTLALFGRVTKVAEECGEAIQALIGVTGQNPRKGVSHTREQLQDELADIAITALCAIQHMTKDIGATDVILNRNLERIYLRTGKNRREESNG